MGASEISHLKGIPAQSILLCYPVAFCGQIIPGKIVIRTLVLKFPAIQLDYLQKN